MAQPLAYTEPKYWTEDEYFAFERRSPGRWEFVHGVVRAMSGGTIEHNTIAGNVFADFKRRLNKSRCRVIFADVKVHTGDGVNTFPDVAVICGPREYYQGRSDTVLNPIVIVEVLSPSTQAYDLGDKFTHYKSIPSLREFVAVWRDEPRVVVYTRLGDHWEPCEAVGLQASFKLSALDMAVALSDIYDLIDFGASDDSRAEPPHQEHLLALDHESD